MNGEPGQPRSFDYLEQLLKQQAYRLAYWKVAADEINYRRFFDVNELAALSMEREDVFEAAHQLIFRLLSEEKLDGLRIDHPDGLFDPKQYLQRLQRHFLRARTQEPKTEGLDHPLDIEINQPPLYVVVEKILGRNEALPSDWPVHGTSGYDFLSAINGLFVDGKKVEAFNRLYQNCAQQYSSFREIVYQKKLLILQAALSGEQHMLAQELDRLAQKNRWSRDFTLHSLHHVLREIIACFPVYRSYITAAGVSETDRKVVLSAVRQAMYRNPTISASLFQFVQDILLIESSAESEVAREEQAHFAGKFQQVTAPVMAKGVEDTAFYIFNRLLSLNEVGSDPSYFGMSRASVHRYNQERLGKWPHALSPLSTHDTKRSEDIRARLNVLSEMPGEWEACLARWSRLNAPLKKEIDGAAVPDTNEEYYLYQTLLGAWPYGVPSASGGCDLSCRIKQHLIKALHEAKVHSSWMNPDSGYDDAVVEFAAALLDPKKSAPFLDDFARFQKRISHLGQLNSLSQTLLRITSPGAPDTYQGTELWDLSLVDPDNRRPVDYGRRRQLLEDLKVQMEGKGRLQLAQELVAGREDGRIKLYLTWQGLTFRRAHRGLFSTGEYIPLTVTGREERHVFAFARRQGTKSAIVVVPRLLSSLCPKDKDLPLGAVWSDAKVELPAGLNDSFANLLTGETVDVRDGSIHLSDALKHFPVGLLVSG
jgi:(1->4)-alpha-D-glucan 1-alpha-D-glucosylmutase